MANGIKGNFVKQKERAMKNDVSDIERKIKYYLERQKQLLSELKLVNGHLKALNDVPPAERSNNFGYHLKSKDQLMVDLALVNSQLKALGRY